MKKAFLLGLLITGSHVSIAQEQKITIPMTAKDAEGFAPAGWEIDVVKKGDLNGDKIDDAVIVMTKPEVTEKDSVVEGSKRFLVLAFGGDGQFKRTAFSDVAALDKDEGGAMGDPLGEVEIEKGVVVISHYMGGGSGRSSVTERYRWRQNRWMLIGKRYDEFNVMDLEGGHAIDTNLSTGLVNRTEADIFDQRYKRKPPKKGHYYELQAITTNEAQKIDGLFETGEWQGYVLKLNAKRQVIRGVQFWKGILDVSATLNAVRQGEDLFIRAEVTDDQFSEGDLLRLVDKRGRAIAPEEIKTAPAPKGYNVEARYSMRGLTKLAPQYESLGDRSEILLDEDDVGFPVAVEVIDVDGGAERAALSTKLRGSPFNGSIRAYREGIAVLENK